MKVLEREHLNYCFYRVPLVLHYLPDEALCYVVAGMENVASNVEVQSAANRRERRRMGATRQNSDGSSDEKSSLKLKVPAP
jgi:hypothetical protein